MSTAALVPMVAPDGSVGYVPSDRVNEALSHGGQLGVKMQAPTGEVGIVPRNNVVMAIRNGGKVLQDAAAIDLSQPQQQPGAVARFAGSMGSAMGAPERVSDILTGPAQAVTHPVESGKLLYNAAAQSQQDLIDKAYQYQHSPGLANKLKGFGYGLYSAIPVVGPTLAHAGEQFGTGDIAGGAGTMAGVAAPAVIGKYGPGAVEAVKNIKPPLQGALANRMAEPVGSAFSRGDVLNAAQEHGVNLDLADATGSGVARGVKAYSERSLGGRGTMNANTTTNLQKLGEWADQELEKYAPQSTTREVLGGQTQSALQEDLQMRKTAAATAFEDLDKRIGANSIDGTNTVEAEARNIISEMSDYYAKHPELKPKQAWSVLENLAERPQIEVEEPGKPTIGPMGAEIAGEPVKKMVDAPTHDFSWQELHSLRSDLMDIYRNNPDLVKGKAQGWLQRMVSTIDQTMTDAAKSGLTPDDLEQFRHANELWEGLKDTYDNPQSPLYHAARTQYPSQVAGMLTKGTPELARQVRTAIGSLEGPFQRQFVENLLNDKSGNLDLKNLNSRLSRVPDDFLQSMLGAEGARNLRLLGKVSQRVTANINPSGTSDVIVPAGEIGAASSMLLTHPVAGAAAMGGELATGYGTARALTSPAVVDYLTRPNPVRTPTAQPNNLAALAALGPRRKRK